MAAGGGGVTEETVAALAGPVAAAVPVIASWIPARPAAELGRLGVETVDAARFAAGPHAAGLVQDARQRAG